MHFLCFMTRRHHPAEGTALTPSIHACCDAGMSHVCDHVIASTLICIWHLQTCSDKCWHMHTSSDMWWHGRHMQYMQCMYVWRCICNCLYGLTTILLPMLLDDLHCILSVVTQSSSWSSLCPATAKDWYLHTHTHTHKGIFFVCLKLLQSVNTIS